ncbi:hypothetical protein K2X05_02590 [bacterium]|nr:hypothetical protein [bacterium]
MLNGKKQEELFLSLYFALLAGYAHSLTINLWKQYNLWPSHFSWQLVSLFMIFFFGSFFFAGLFPQILLARLLSIASISLLYAATNLNINLHILLFFSFHILISLAPSKAVRLFFLFLNFLKIPFKKIKIFIFCFLGFYALCFLYFGPDDTSWLYSIVACFALYPPQQIDLNDKVS